MSDIHLLYIGQGASLYGVPARNLSEEEVAIHGEDRLLKSGLYKLVKSKERKTYSKRFPKIETNDEVNNE